MRTTTSRASGSYYISRESQTMRNVLWLRAFVCLCVCLFAAACLHYCTDPDITWGSCRGCSLVVHCWADLQSMHGLRCCGNITLAFVSDIAVFVLKRDVTLQPTNQPTNQLTSLTNLSSPRDMTAQCEREMLASALYSLYAQFYLS